MRVLNVLGSLNYSGAELMILHSKKDFEKIGITNDILITNQIRGKAYSDFKKNNFHIHQIIFNKKKIIKIFFNFLVFFKLIIFFFKKKYDVIIIHTESDNLKLSLSIKFLSKSQVIRVIHSVFKPSIIFKLRRKIILFFLKNLNVKFISVSNCVKKNELILYKNKTHLINNFFDTEKFKLLKLKKTKDTTNTIFVVGNCSKIKNHGMIFKSLSQLPVNFKWRLIHVGKECDQRFERKLAKKLNIYNNCNFIGEKFNWYKLVNRNDIFINSSLNEGIGISSLEATSLGMLPLLSNVPGNKTLLKHINKFINLKFCNEKELTDKLIKIFKISKKNKNYFTNKLSKEINTFFSKKKYIDGYIYLLKKVIL